jgi:hypothetical protein
VAGAEELLSLESCGNGEEDSFTETENTQGHPNTGRLDQVQYPQTMYLPNMLIKRNESVVTSK